MEFFYLTVRCFLHPGYFFSEISVELIAPTLVRVSPEIPSVERSPRVELKPRSHSAEPSSLKQVRSSPGLSAQEYHKYTTMFNDKLKRAFKNFEYVRKIAETVKKEMSVKAGSDQQREWLVLCDNFKESTSKSAGSIAIGKQVMGDLFDMQVINAEELYVKMLHLRIQKLFETQVRILNKFDMFKKYEPMVLYVVQKEFIQEHIIPTEIDNFLSYAEAVKLKLLPSNIKTYIPLDEKEKWTFCCVGLFHSFVHSVNFVTAYWRTDTGKWVSSLVNFDRHNVDKI
jgi:hypothetical protein